MTAPITCFTALIDIAEDEQVRVESIISNKNTPATDVI